MLERILLAAVMTFCIYLFLNLGEKSSDASTSNMPTNTASFIR